MSDFTFPPSTNSTGSVDPRTLESSYGGGYEQRSGDGLNNTPQKWNLLFTNRSITDLNTIHTFLKGKGGWQSFTWTPPAPFDTTEGEIRVKCKHWDWVYDGGDVVGITATFDQVPTP